MAKMALCIKRQDLDDLTRILRYPTSSGSSVMLAPEGFLRLATTLEDRATCETDTSLLQLLPYVTIQRADTGQYLVYCRGKGGNEQRLHGKLSMGVGGHVDTALPGLDPAMFYVYDVHLQEHLDATAIREITEEIGINFNTTYPSGEGLEIPDEMWTGCLIRDDSDSVGQVHLGLAYTLIIPDASVLGATEVGVIEGSRWLTIAEIMEDDVFLRLENWSKIVATDLSGYGTTDHEEKLLPPQEDPGNSAPL